MASLETSSKNNVGYVKVEQPFGVQAPNIHCPICGQAAANEDGDNPCPHVSFIFYGVIGDFAYMSDDFESSWQTIDNDEIDFITFPELLSQAGYGNNFLALEISYGGMHHGEKSWYTDVYGFNFDALTADFI